MLTALLIVLAPFAIIVLPWEFGVPVAAFTVILLLYRELRGARDAALADEARRKAREAQAQESMTEIGKLHAQRVKEGGALSRRPGASSSQGGGRTR
jgi:heme exporter protein D